MYDSVEHSMWNLEFSLKSVKKRDGLQEKKARIVKKTQQNYAKSVRI